MPRPKQPRRICFNPQISYFKPRGIPLRELAEVVLLPDEIEALRLHDVENLDHISAATSMKISQPTFTRLLNTAYKKIADALIHGKAIRLDKSP